MMTNDIQANPEVLAKATDDLTAYVEKYFSDNKIDLATCFMCVHMIHKRLVVKIARVWSINGLAELQVYRMADLTFRKAIRELRRD